MNKAARNAIERATQQARKLLDDDFSSQLEGTFDVLRSGVIAPKGGVHLLGRQQFQRDKIVAAIEHKRAAGTTAVEAVTDYVRDAAFTTLNRFVALKMLEARQLVQECITKGEQSGGYREFWGMAPGVALLPDVAGYRLYVESLFDEFSTEIKVLFDRRDAASILWPKRQTFEALLTILNASELSEIWGEDETIGWVYQFFNSGEERKKMRDKSQTPRNSRELAVRNQFFTPRYVVQFLVDNTLGSLWQEMHGEHTRIAEICEYLVRRPEEPVQPRPRKDPRDLRILDPACGSGHFLLYSFDLLLAIYEETWSAEGVAPRSELTGRSLREDYPNLADLRRAVPRLIVEHNLHGVDIDPRCAQIAALALWLRAQRAWKDLGIAAADRPRIQRTHIVVAEPMPGDAALVDEFAARLDPPLLRDLFKKMVNESRLAGELGTLLRVEDAIATDVRRAREQFVRQRQTTGFLPGLEPTVKQGDLNFSGIDDDGFFHEAGTRMFEALRAFAETATGNTGVRRRLFAGDATQGIALIDVVRARFDVVLMNPPFGAGTENSEDYAEEMYPLCGRELACSFIERALELLKQGGRVGVIATRMPLFIKSYAEWREIVLTKGRRIRVFVDLGRGVLDATVESAAYVLAREADGVATYFKAMSGGMVIDQTAELLRDAIKGGPSLAHFTPSPKLYDLIPNWPVAYWVKPDLAKAYANFPRLESAERKASSGASTNDDFRFLRLWCEVPPGTIACKRADTFGARPWVAIAKGGEYSPYFRNVELLLNWGDDGAECKAFISDYRGKKGWGFHWAAALNGYVDYFRPGVTWSRRTSTWISGRALPRGCIFGDKGPAVFVPTDDPRELTEVLAWINSSVISALLELSVGKEGSQGTAAASSYEVGIVERLPFPVCPELTRAGEYALDAVYLRQERTFTDELSRLFRGPQLNKDDFQAVARSAFSLQRNIDTVLGKAFALSDETLEELEINSRLESLNTAAPFESVLRLKSQDQFLDLQFVVGCIFGRWNIETLTRTPIRPGPFDVLPDYPPAAVFGDHGAAVRAILVEDEGHPQDIVRRCSDVVERTQEPLQLPANLRHSIQSNFFSQHIAAYSRSRRRAPIYWQLSIPSAQYSVWLYAHACTGETLYEVQNDFIALKLEHEERQLEILRAENQGNANAQGRKQIAMREAFIEELRWFLDEVKRVAPLWKPLLNDGVVLAMAPLWRLVPHLKPWQKELKNKWDELVAGNYDWAHLAMHLWPERVVPKCATDRSLAIAHGLEGIFFVEGDDRKWKPRPTPMRSVDELVRERTSIAVKSALKNLLEAPAANASRGRGRGRRAADAPLHGGAA